MQELEQRLQQRFPDWFHGRRGQLARPLLRSVGRWSRLDQIEAFLQRSSGLRGFGFVAAGLEFIGGQYQVDPAALAKIPATGRLLIVANHPPGHWMRWHCWTRSAASAATCGSWPTTCWGRSRRCRTCCCRCASSVARPSAAACMRWRKRWPPSSA
jgi:hypothetical protein